MEETVMDAPVTEAVVETQHVETPAADTSAETVATGGEQEATSDLDAYLEAQLKEEKPADGAVVAEAAQQPSDEFKQVLGLSEYVKAPEHVAMAVRAANEVWDVANGKLPASQMLEGMRAASPQGFEKVVGDLIPYLERITGQKFGAGEAAAPDPVAELRAEIAAQQQQQQLERQQAAYAQTVNQVAPIFKKAIAETLGKQFGEGHEQYFIARIANLVPEAKMVQALASGDMKPLESAMKQVKAEELTRFKAYSAALIQQSKEFRKSLPAAKGGSGDVAAGTKKFDLKTTEGRLAYANAAFNGEV